MDLTLSEEHEALRATVEEFAHKEVAPVIGEPRRSASITNVSLARMSAATTARRRESM